MLDSSRWSEISIRKMTLPTETWNPAAERRAQITYVDVSAVSKESLEISAPTVFVGDQAPGRARKIIRDGDVIYATIRPTLKTIARVPKELDNQIASTAFCVLRPDPQIVDPAFLFYAVQTDSITSRIAALQTGASYPAIRDNDVLDQVIALPPLVEQQQIAKTLDALRDAITLEKRMINVGRILKQQTMRHLFKFGLTNEPLKESEIGPVPQNWSVGPLTSVCTMRSGGTPPKSAPEFWTGNYPWVSGKDLKGNRLQDSNDHITEDAARQYSKIAPAGSVLVLVRGMGLVNGFALSLIERPMAFNQDLKALVPKEGMSGVFLMHALTYAGQRMLQSVSDAAHGTKRLGQSDLDRFKVPIPLAEEQEAISTILDAIDQKLDHCKRKKILLEKLFRTLLQKLMNGELPQTSCDLLPSRISDAGEVAV